MSSKIVSNFFRRRAEVLLKKSAFPGARLFVSDAALMLIGFLSSRLLSIWLIVFAGTTRRKLGLTWCEVLKGVFISEPEFEGYDAFEDAWLVSAWAHVREKTILKTLGSKLGRIFLLDHPYPETSRAAEEAISRGASVPVVHIHGDWIAVWFLILANYAPRRLFLLSSLDDLSFMPLKLHPFKNHIAFDAYDPISEFRDDPFRKRLSYWNYKFGKLYVVRDSRFRVSLRRSGNREALTCYMPDMPHFEVIDKIAVLRKFQNIEKIKFVSSGWVTSGGDDGVLRTFKLIRTLWPNSEIHLCLTQMMTRENSLFVPLIEFMDRHEGCFVYDNLQGEAYKAVIQNAHVGIALHDRAVFGEPYEEVSPATVRRCPSARILDYAALGCVLMTTNMHRFGQHLFKLNSPHERIFIISHKTNPDALCRILKEIAGPC